MFPPRWRARCSRRRTTRRGASWSGSYWCERPGNHLLALSDPAYPPALANIADPPPLLYLRGRPELLTAPALAIVGSRNATSQGKANAEVFAAALSCAGLAIVSGLALGIDAAAHRGALGGIGSTVAVIGTGADQFYPAANRALARHIAARGAGQRYPSARPWDTIFRRNRIISGLAAGVRSGRAAARSAR
jgi:DNA processing protein